MTYTTPPIVESVIEYQFAGDVSESDRSRIAKKLKKRYPSEEIIQEIILEGSQNVMRQSMSAVGTKLSSKDRTEILTLSGASRPGPDQFGPATFSASQLAPYCGWEAFLGRFALEWAAVEQVIGHRKLQRIGVRYINRIDIPGKIDNPSHWIKFGTRLPDNISPATAFTMQLVIPLDNAQCNILIGIAPSPLPHHSGIIFDIDVYTIAGISDKNEDRIKILHEFREKKNYIFESGITDAARELFK